MKARAVVMQAGGGAKQQQRHVVVLGGGIQGASAAYHLGKRGCKVSIVELEQVGSAASGKAGGFLARDWGSGPTVALHKESFRMHQELASELELETFREIETLSVSSGARGNQGKKMRSWLDGDVAKASLLDTNTAQVTPLEITSKLAMAAVDKYGAEIVYGRALGVVTSSEQEEKGEASKVTGVRVKVDNAEEKVIPCSDLLVAMGVWSTLTAPWFGLPENAWPITGIKSTHVIWKERKEVQEDPAALFCGQERNGTHLEIYPRSNGDLYACGIGGSDYVEDRARLAVGGDCETPSSVKADTKRVKAANDSAGKLSSILQAPPDHVGACIRPCPPDAQPFMGRISGMENAYISAGHNCWGILWGPVSGLLMAELIVEGEAKTVDIRPFSPDRFLPRPKRGGRGRKKGSVDVGEQW